MNEYAASIRQHDTHRRLVGQSERGNAQDVVLGLDAIIVPASRPATYLDHAITLARAADCWLVVLCSQQLRGAEVQEFVIARSFSRAIIIDIPAGYSHKLLRFPGLDSIKAELPLACEFYSTDLSLKRNIGLVLAKMMRWRRIFFLDDDIRDITYPDLQRTVDMLGSFSAAGMWVTYFPDNSIACHANRMTDGLQDVFVSGAVLAVDCASDIGFFPDIYNEDWLFFFDAAMARQLGNSYRKATQLYYYPFADARRAAWQEFGDVLAEGLYALLHLGLDVQQATPEYWEHFLEARRDFLEETLTRADQAPPDMREEIIASLQSALKCLTEISPGLCARYVQLWRQDLAEWKRRVARIPWMPSLEAALKEMRLVSVPATGQISRMLASKDNTPRTPVSIPRIGTLKHLRQRRQSGRELASSTSARPSWQELFAGHHLLQQCAQVGTGPAEPLITRVLGAARLGEPLWILG